MSATDYLQRANESVVVLVQIETHEGYANLEEILSVDGLGASGSILRYHSRWERLNSRWCTQMASS